MTPAEKRLATISTYACLLPGAGHLLLKRWQPAIGVAAFVTASAAITVYQLAVGLAVFDSALGGFAFGALLRAALALWGLSFVDVYLSSTTQGNSLRRYAIAANLLLPGVGYLLAKSWSRAAGSFVVVSWLVVTARAPGRYYDLILLALQAVTAFEVYQRLVLAELKEADQRHPPPAEQVAAAQVVLPFVLTAAAIGIGWITIARLSATSPLFVSKEDVTVERDPGRLRVAVPKLGIRFWLAGDGWRVKERGEGLLLRAQHRRGASLLVGAFPLRPFVKRARQLRTFSREATRDGYRVQIDRATRVGRFLAHTISTSRVSGDLATSRHVDAVALGKTALVFVLTGEKKTCQELHASLEKTLASLQVSAN